MTTRKSFTAALLAIGVVACLSWARGAEAHTIGLSTGEYTAKGSSVVAKLAFARGEMASLVPSMDGNLDGHLTAAEIDAARGTLKDKVFGRIAVTAGGRVCTPAITDAGLTEQDGILLAGRWDCPSIEEGESFNVELSLLDDLSRGHRHVARTIGGGKTRDQVLYGDERKVEIASSGDTGTRAAAHPESGTAGEPEAERPTSFWSFFKMGIEHILTGYDHLVFIMGLILARAGLRSLLTIITAFTVAHSITLGLAVTNVWAPSSRVIEPAIALSIAYVGIENFFVKDASKRWRITFPFGLIHGFGFAGALQEINLSAKAVPTALVSFNLGVEAGQLAVLVVLLPLVLYARDKSWFEPRGVRVVSGAVALAGGIWFVERIVSG